MGPLDFIHTVPLLPEEGIDDFTAKFSATVKDLDEDTDMTAGLSGSPVAGTNVISAGTNGNVAGTGNWSIKGGLLTSPTAMVKQSQTALKVQESNAPVNTTVNVDYDFSTGASQLPGTYQDTIVYTAAVK